MRINFLFHFWSSGHLRVIVLHVHISSSSTVRRY